MTRDRRRSDRRYQVKLADDERRARKVFLTEATAAMSADLVCVACDFTAPWPVMFRHVEQRHPEVHGVDYPGCEGDEGRTWRRSLTPRLPDPAEVLGERRRYGG